jgi:putative membrane protein (TIGR04086 family)
MSAKQQNSLLGLFARFTVSFVVGAIITAGALAACAQGIVLRGSSQSLIVLFATAAVCLGGLLAGFCMARLQKSGGLLCGILQGGLFCVVLLLTTFIKGGTLDFVQGLRFLAILLCSVLGGALGVARAAKARRKH